MTLTIEDLAVDFGTSVKVADVYGHELHEVKLDSVIEALQSVREDGGK